MNIYNSSKNNLISNNAKIAKNFISRAIGLLFKKQIENEESLVIFPSFSIHTFFMNFPIDILFVNKKNEIIALYENVLPNKILPIHFNSMYVVELKSGTIGVKNIEIHDIIQIDE